MIKKTALTFTLALCFAFAAMANDFQNAVNNFVNQDFLKNASVGICVMDVNTGEVVAANTEDLAVITASTMKTVTSASALELLGKDFKFHTEVMAVGKIKGNKLLGNVVVVGHGDPTLGSRYFKDMPNIVDVIKNALREKGIHKIEGKILFDESAYPFETFSERWMVEDLAYNYGPGVHAINYSDNLVNVSFDRSGDVPTDFVLKPNVQNLEIVCHATIHEKTLDMHRLLNIGPKPNITIYGTVARNKKRYSSDFVNPNPAQLLCDSITTVLSKNNIELKNKTFKKSQLADTLLLVDYQSPSLQDIVISLLDRSDNMFTEAVLRAIAVGAGKEATANNGIDEVHALWKSKGIDTTPLFQRDGSGLARNGRASARFFTQMLRQVNADSTIINVKFPSLMTKLGVNAHIGKKIKNSAMKGKIASKSGSMSDVQCYVGYFPADNPKYTWACLVNNWQGARAHLKDEIEVLLLNLFAGLNGTETPVEQ